MVSITRNVSDIPAGDIPALEHLIGARLQPSQTVLVQVLDAESVKGKTSAGEAEPQLPEWCNVYEGLSDEQIARLEEEFEPLDFTRDRR